MSRTEEVELTNMCMICDGKGNVLVQNKKTTPRGTVGISPEVMLKKVNMLPHRLFVK